MANEGYGYAAEATLAAEDCLKALLKDASTDVMVFLSNWAAGHSIPEAERDGFIRRAREQLATAVALSQLADMASYVPSGPDSEEYSRNRKQSLHSEVSAMFKRKKRAAWHEDESDD